MTDVDLEAGKEFLEHYGVKGMRWGVRRTDAQLARSSGKKESESGDGGGGKGGSESKAAVRGKSASQMSDKELKKVVERINTEKQYNQLTAPKPGKAATVGKFFANIAVNAARTNLQQVANKQGSVVVGQLFAAKAAKGAPRIPPPPNRFPGAPPNPLDRVG